MLSCAHCWSIIWYLVLAWILHIWWPSVAMVEHISHMCIATAVYSALVEHIQYMYVALV